MKNKNVKIITPSGIAQYPWLTTADTKFSETGEFKTNLILSKKDALPVSQIPTKCIQFNSISVEDRQV